MPKLPGDVHAAARLPGTRLILQRTVPAVAAPLHWLIGGRVGAESGRMSDRVDEFDERGGDS